MIEALIYLALTAGAALLWYALHRCERQKTPFRRAEEDEVTRFRRRGWL